MNKKVDKIMSKWVVLLSSLFLVQSVQSQSIAGKWKTIDDETGKARSVVEIYEKGDMYYGKIVEIFTDPGEDPDPVCTACDEEDSRYKKKVKGMEIIKGLEKDSEDREYEDGTILDPESGNVYDCKIWLGEEGNLKVRGYVSFFYRTQTWLPVE